MNHENSSSSDHVLMKTKSKKSHKKHGCHDCCVSDCNPDCCTPAFQRLDKLRNQWVNTNLGIVPSGTLYDRAGATIPVFADASGVEISYGNNDLTAYYFVNVVRYLLNEECGKLDQVTGWHVDIQSGDLVMYQNLYDLNLSPSVSRLTLLNTPSTELSTIQAKQLKNMEPFWKLSLKAVERVQQNPKEEGNICEIVDKCKNKFLVAINRGNGSTSVCEYTSQYSIVVIKLC